MDYSITVHSVKSSSKLIGAMTLSQQAAELEAAADAGDADTVFAKHDPMMEKFEEVNVAIRSLIPQSELEEDEGEILEFFPTGADGDK